MSVCSGLTFESLDLESVPFGTHIHLQNLQVRFVYQGYWVTVEVTGARSVRSYPTTPFCDRHGAVLLQSSDGKSVSVVQGMMLPHASGINSFVHTSNC